MKDLFLKRKQAFRKECVGYLRYVLNDHFVLFLLVLLGFLAYQYSQLLQDFPENHWPILLFVGITSVLLLLWGGIATYMEAPDKLFLLVGEEEIKLHLKRQTGISLVFWLFVLTLFFAVICALIFGNGLWLACFSGLCAFIGGRKIFPLSSKGQQIFH